MKTQDFHNAVLAAPNGLGSVVALTVRARSVTVRTYDDHAAHAVEMLATRRGLTVTTERGLATGGEFVATVTGFSR